jgi:hypothetical protein
MVIATVEIFMVGMSGPLVGVFTGSGLLAMVIATVEIFMVGMSGPLAAVAPVRMDDKGPGRICINISIKL